MSILHMNWLIPPNGRPIFVNDKHIIINQAAIAQLNLSPNPVGEVIHLGDDNLVIEGVVKNFNYTSLHNKIDALALFVEKDSAITWGANLNGCLFVKIAPHVNIPSLMETIQKIYGKYDPQTVCNFEFLDDAFNAGYKAEERLASIFSIFTGLMIVIACLGLFALVAYSVAQRTREIGIRKVLGATIQGIVALLAKDFILYIMVAILIAIPVTLIAMNRWLNNFAYRISLGWGIFALAGILTIGLALLTISGIAIRAAKANPVKNLRTE
jgi:putative ABC transport system permease protein